jgi:orotidine-5'-phosphate decarboxylase
MTSRFREMISERWRACGSPIILALDPTTPRGDLDLLEWCGELVERLSPGLSGVKIGYPLLFSLGSKGVKGFIDGVRNHHPDLPILGDFKVADIANTNLSMTRHLFDLGIDAVIFHLFTGYEGGYDAILEEAERLGKGAIGVAYMSHPGAEAIYQDNYQRLVMDAVDHGVDGLVVPSTRPRIIEAVKMLVGNRCLLFAPGVGAQGGDPRETLERGADYIIIGRSLYGAPDPVKALRDFLASIK